jgi:hypothetical protein
LINNHLTKENKMTNLQEHFDAYLAESAKFEAGNNAAGTRARKALAELGKAVKARRNEITETKNARIAAKAK